MSRPSPTPSPAVLSRRTALAGALAAGAAACTPYEVEQPTLPAPRRQPRGVDPDVALAATVLGDEMAMVDRVDATLAAHPAMAERLALTREVHLAHVELLNDAVPETRSKSASPAPSPSASPAPSPPASASVIPVPPDRRLALAELARAEKELSLLDKRSAFAAESGAFARVLASMAAAAAQQAALLGGPDGAGDDDD